MICSTCGRDERTDANFCSQCGRVLAWRVNPAAVPPGPLYGTQLQRPHEGRMVAGVCAGLALHYGWDVSLLRILLLLSLFVTAGVTVVAYLAAWIVMPKALYLLPAGMPYGTYPAPPAGTMGR